MMYNIQHMFRALFFFFQAEDGIRDLTVTGVQTCALPISAVRGHAAAAEPQVRPAGATAAERPGRGAADHRALGAARACPLPGGRSEEHTSELQSQSNLVCRLLLEKKNIRFHDSNIHSIVLCCKTDYLRICTLE